LYELILQGLFNSKYRLNNIYSLVHLPFCRLYSCLGPKVS